MIKTLAGLTGDVSIGSGGFGYNAAMALTNNGLISSQVSGRTLTINPATSFTNAGTLEAINGGNLAVPLGYTQTAGVTRLSGGGTISALNGLRRTRSPSREADSKGPARSRPMWPIPARSHPACPPEYWRSLAM